MTSRLFSALLSALMIISSGAVLCTAEAYTLESVQEALTAPKTVRADFMQERELKGFSQSLSSEGNFLYSKDEGILWTQTKPFPLEIKINDEAIVQKSGASKQVLSFADNPSLHAFGTLLKSLITLDTEALSKFFAIEFKDKASSWELILTPQSAPLDKIFTQIVLNGTQSVDEISLYDGAGDRTHLKFFNQEISSAGLSAKERLRFE